MYVKAFKTRLFKEKEDLLGFITSHIKKLSEGDILAVTSKIVALAEGRVKTVTAKEKDDLIKKESKIALKTKYVWLTVKDNTLMANAGIDESNALGKVILLPRDSFKAAELIRKTLKKHYKLKRLGVVITDSRTEALRRGITGKALSYAGFQGVKDYVGKKDLYGRKFKFESVNVADSLASAAVYEMGEGNESKPLAVIQDVEVKFQEKINKREAMISLKKDMYAPLFKSLFKK
ncbi:MAG TPA: coenzyme F420-0:L-glutamate ligase [Candidatus Paceibacterota bacterium]|nr:coenzyme F420-0:L-glutamate ligase [Candidatus Paceibacterota bacterium]